MLEDLVKCKSEDCQIDDFVYFISAAVLMHTIRLMCGYKSYKNWNPILSTAGQKWNCAEFNFKSVRPRKVLLSFIFASTFFNGPIMSWRSSGRSNEELVENLKGK